MKLDKLAGMRQRRVGLGEILPDLPGRPKINEYDTASGRVEPSAHAQSPVRLEWWQVLAVQLLEHGAAQCIQITATNFRKFEAAFPAYGQITRQPG